jgi:hypothetical protein
MTSLRLLPNISTCAFIFRARRWHKDVIDPGASWFLLPINGDEQTEYKIHEDWCPIVRSFEKKSKEYIEHDIVKNKKGWQKRPPGPNITIKVIGGREMGPLPFSPSYYEPPGMDFFG